MFPDVASRYPPPLPAEMRLPGAVFIRRSQVSVPAGAGHKVWHPDRRALSKDWRRMWPPWGWLAV